MQEGGGGLLPSGMVNAAARSITLIKNIMEINVTDVNFKEVVLESKLPVMVDFWAIWCGPCRMIGPIVEELAKEYEGKAVIAKCNVDEASDAPVNYGIRNIPTLLFFKNGELKDKLTGANTKENIEAKLKALL